MTDSDDAVIAAEDALAAALLRRITEGARHLYPEAATLHTYFSDYENGQVLWKIHGPRLRILWNRENFSHPRVDDQLEQDVIAYARLPRQRLKELPSEPRVFTMKLLPVSFGMNRENVPTISGSEAVHDEVDPKLVRTLMGGVRSLLDTLADEATKTMTGTMSEEEWAIIMPRVATEGIDTPGCDCGHDGMGSSWHFDCAWRKAQR